MKLTHNHLVFVELHLTVSVVKNSWLDFLVCYVELAGFDIFFAFSYQLFFFLNTKHLEKTRRAIECLFRRKFKRLVLDVFVSENFVQSFTQKWLFKKEHTV